MMKLFIISTIFTLWYAWSRSMHDKHLFGTDYKWHWWALQEAIILNTVFCIGMFLLNDILAWKFIILWIINALFFWMVFDCLMGWHAKKDIWYIGNTGFDKQIRLTFYYYTRNIKGKVYFGVKLLAYIIFTLGAYFELSL